MIMNIGINNYNNFYTSQKSNYAQSFEGASARKLIDKIKKATQLKKLGVTFEELANAYKEIGYDVFFKRGSHAVVPIDKNLNIPVIIPHKDKYVTPYELKRFRYVLNGEFDKAARV